MYRANLCLGRFSDFEYWHGSRSSTQFRAYLPRFKSKNLRLMSSWLLCCIFGNILVYIQNKEERTLRHHLVNRSCLQFAVACSRWLCLGEPNREDEVLYHLAETNHFVFSVVSVH